MSKAEGAPDYLKHLDEDHIKFLELMTETILHHSDKINEGNNGVILKLDLGNEENREIITKVMPEFGQDDLVAKMLKLYKPGQAGTEVKMQAEAFRIIEEMRANELGVEYAQIPRVYLDETINVEGGYFKERLNEMNIEVNSENKVEVVLMDYINGVDLATYLDRLIIANHPGLVHLREHLKPGERWNFDEMHQQVAQALGFEVPGRKSWNEKERFFEEQKVFNENRKKLVDYLKDNNIVIDKRILNSVRNTIQFLHKNNIYHGDLHERNIMIKFVDDDMTKIEDVFLIDFGRASVKSGLVSPDEEQLNDEAVFSHYWKLQTTKAEDMIDARRFETVKWEMLLDNIKNNESPKLNELYLELEENVVGYLREGLLDIKKFEKYLNKESDLELLLASLLDNIQIFNDKEKIFVLIDYLRDFVRNKKLPPYISNRLVLLKDILADKKV